MARKGQKKKRWLPWRITRGFLLFVLALVALVAIVLVVVTRTDWGRDRVRREALSALAGLIQGDLELDRIRGNLLGDFALEGIRIKDRDGNLVIGAKELSLDYDPSTLLDERVDIAALHLVEPTVTLRVDEDGAVNLSGLFQLPESKDEGPSPWVVDIQDLWIDGARVDFGNLVPELGVVEGVTLRGSVHVEGGKVDTRLETVAMAIPAHDQRLEGSLSATVGADRVAARLALDGSGFRVRVPTATLFSDTRNLVAAIDLWAEEALVDRYAPQVQLDTDGRVSLVVMSTGLDRFSVLGGIEAGQTEVGLVAMAVPAEETAAVAVSLPASDLHSVVEVVPPELELGDLRLAGRVMTDGTVQANLVGDAGGFGVARQHLELSVGGDRRALRVKLRSSGGGAQVNVDGGIELGDSPVLSRTTIRVEAPSLSRVVNLELPVAVGVSASLVARGPLGDLSVGGTIEVRDLVAEGLRVSRATARVQASGLPESPALDVSVTAGEVVAGGQSLSSVRAELDLAANGRLAVSAAVDGEELAVQTRASGRFVDGDLQLDIGALAGRFRDLRFGGVGGRLLRTQNGTLRVGELQLEVAGGQLDASVTVQPTSAGSQIDAEVHARSVSVPQLRGVIPAIPEGSTGTATVDATFALGPRRTEAKIDAQLSATFAGMPPLELETRVALGGATLEASVKADVDKGWALLDLSGVLRTPRDVTSPEGWRRLGRGAVQSLALDAKVANLDSLPDFWPDSPVVGGSMRVVGNVEDGGQRGKLDLEVKDIETVWIDIKPELDVEANLDGTDLKLTAALGAGALGTVAIDADLETPVNLVDVATWRERGLASVDRAVIRLDEFWPTPRLWQLAEVESPPKGSLTAKVEVHGVDRKVILDADLSQFQIRPLRAPAAMVVHAEIEDAKATAQLRVGLGGAPVASAEASLGLGLAAVISDAKVDIAGAPYEVELASEVLNLPVVARQAGLGEIVGGRAQLTVEGKGTLGQPRGELALQITSARYEGVELERALLTVSATDRTLEARLEAQQKGGGNIDFRASSEWNVESEPRRSMQLFARDFEIGLLSSLGPPSIRGLGGRLFGDLRVGGRGNTVESARGVVELRDGRVKLDGPLRRLSNVDASIRANPGFLGIKVSAEAGDGRMEIDSKVNLDGFRPTSLEGKLEARKLPLATAAGTVELSLEGGIEGGYDGDEVSIDIEIEDGLIKMPTDQGRELHDIGPPTDVVFVSSLAEGLRNEDDDTAASPFPPIVVNVDIPQSVDVRGENLNGVLGANLDITVANGRVTFLGYAELLRGWIKIFRHRYDIEKALASFDATREFNPRVDIVLRHEFKTAQFTVSIQGDLDEPPKPEFSAEPGIYDDAQLLSFFLGGSPDDLGRQRDNSARAAGAATSLVTSQLTGIVQEILPVVDVLALESSDESATPDQLLAGKWLTDRVLLAYRARLAGTNDRLTNTNEVTIEVWFLKRWLLQAFYGDNQVGAADVLWIRRF